MADDLNKHRRVATAIAYADELWVKYYDAVKTQSRLSSGGGLGMIGLAGGAAAGGAAGASPDLILGLASGAGGTYAGTTLLHSRPRQYVYLAGLSALNCAVSATLPFNIAEADMRSLEAARTQTISGGEDALSDAKVTLDSVRHAKEAMVQAKENLVASLRSIATEAAVGNPNALAAFLNGEVTELEKFLAFQRKEVERLRGQHAAKARAVSTLRGRRRYAANADLQQIKGRLTEAETVYSELSQISQGFDRIRAELRQALRAVRDADLAEAPGSRGIAQLEGAVRKAESTINAVPELREKAIQLLRRINESADALIAKVDAIQAEVSRQVVRTEPDLLALGSMMRISMPQLPVPAAPATPGQTPGVTNAPTDLGNEPAPADENRGAGEPDDMAAAIASTLEKYRERLNSLTRMWREEEIEPKTGELQRRTTALNTDAQTLSKAVIALRTAIKSDEMFWSNIRAIIAAVEVNVSQSRIGDCLVQPEAGEETISFTPRNPVVVTQGTTNTIAVRGAKGGQWIIDWPVPEPKLKAEWKKLENPPEDVIQVSAEADCPAATYTFLLKGPNRVEKPIILVVKAK